MKKLYSWHDPLLIGHLRNVIAGEGIRCETRNDLLSSVAGEVPPTECWPELWVDEADFHRATELINEVLVDGDTTEQVWTCPECHEEIDGQFAACWNCLTVRPEGSSIDQKTKATIPGEK